jgi:hypothetical protein
MPTQTKQSAPKGRAHALAEEVRAAGHEEIARKLEVLHELHSRLNPDEDGHRPLTEEEVKLQRDHALALDERTAAQEVEYGTYVAKEDIFHGAALAYAEGHPVPISNVELHGYDRLGAVRRVNPQVKATAEPKGGTDGA